MSRPLHSWHAAMFAMGVLVCMFIAVMVSVQASDRARIEQRKSDCVAINIINDAYRREAAELTGPGREIAGAWEYLASKC